MFLKFVQRPGFNTEKVGCETFYDNVERISITRNIKVETFKQYEEIFECQNPRPYCIEEEDILIEQPVQCFSAFQCNSISFFQKGKQFPEIIYFNCPMYVMNDEGQTVDTVYATHNKILQS